jgi:hypothetical protein
MPSISHRFRLFSAAALTAACTLLSGTPAHAAEGIEPTPQCDNRGVEYPFAPSDPAPYVLVPGGAFECGTDDWALTGDANVVAGNRPLDDLRNGTSSLFLPPGSTATSPEMEIGLAYPTLRFFARKSKASFSRLAVTVFFRTPDGDRRQLKLGEIDAGTQFAPTRRLYLLVNLLALHPNWDRMVWFRFTPTGTDGDWWIDDVYVDPYGK